MEFYEVINSRRTIREFANKSIPQDALVHMLDAGLKAPSSDRLRQWSPVVITDKDAIARVAKCVQALPCTITEPKSPRQEMFQIAFPKQHTMLAEAGCLILPYFKQSSDMYTPHHVFGLINYGATWALIENILLAAVAEGLGCAIHVPTGTEGTSIQQAVHAPSGYVLPAVIAVGYPMENAEVPTQVSASAEEKVHWNKW